MEEVTEGPDLPCRVGTGRPGSCLLSTAHFVGVSETRTPTLLTSGGTLYNRHAPGVHTHLGSSLSPADVGPVTLTADPELFQRELRELYVQVGCPAPGCWLPGPSKSVPEAKVLVPPRGHGGGCWQLRIPAPSSVRGRQHVSWGSWRFYISDFFPLFSETSKKGPSGGPVPGT